MSRKIYGIVGVCFIGSLVEIVLMGFGLFVSSRVRDGEVSGFEGLCLSRLVRGSFWFRLEVSMVADL